MFLIRAVFQAKRGMAPEVVDLLKTLNNMFISMGNDTWKLYVDFAGEFDTVVLQVDVDSLDQFFNVERGLFSDPDTGPLMARVNENSVGGRREIYEVIV